MLGKALFSLIPLLPKRSVFPKRVSASPLKRSASPRFRVQSRHRLVSRPNVDVSLGVAPWTTRDGMR
jgi:hypothetical protein